MHSNALKSPESTTTKSMIHSIISLCHNIALSMQEKQASEKLFYFIHSLKGLTSCVSELEKHTQKLHRIEISIYEFLYMSQLLPSSLMSDLKSVISEISAVLSILHSNEKPTVMDLATDLKIGAKELSLKTQKNIQLTIQPQNQVGENIMDLCMSKDLYSSILSSLIHLIRNSASHVSLTNVEVSVQFIHKNHNLEIIVCDNGSGLNQAKTSQCELNQISGMGLGLKSINHLVAMNKGVMIECRDEEKMLPGACFSLFFPLK